MSFFEDIGRNNAQLSHLRTALAQLPHSIPLGNSKYNFEHYAPDPERVELYGSTEAALNNVLEVTFAPRGRKDESAPCPFEFQERGPGLVAVVDVPSSTNTENAKGDSEALDIDAGDYEDSPEPVAQGPGGRPIDTKLISLAIRCYKKDDPFKTHMFRCAGTNTGCTLKTNSHSTLFDVDLDSNGQKRKHDNSESQAEANPEPQDSDSDSEDNWLEESEDPEIERDPMYRSCDTRVLVGSEDAHLDAPRLLDLLSEKPVEGASRTPQLQDSTVPTPPGGPVQWAFALP
ncbi:hypothetical protein DFH29DRAFT_1069907 [Suillus ampliporus]|nr:hypothetical protein DFH29DRAFT_1069907 [Suillus ampliporus]